MKVEGAIEKFALSVAIGSVLILGAFLIADAVSSRLFSQFESYAASSTWAVVAAVPAITFAYIVGAFTQVIADIVIRRFAPEAEADEWRVIEHLALADSDVLETQFLELRRSKKLLEGSLGPLCVLGIGILFQARNLRELSPLLIVCGAFVLVLAASTPQITSRIQRGIVRTGEVAERVAMSRRSNSETSPRSPSRLAPDEGRG